MGQQVALLSTLDCALDHFRRIEHERNEALTHLRAIEQEVNILKVLTSPVSTGPASGMMKYRRTAMATVPIDLDGLYNHGYKDRALIWLTRTLKKSPDPDLRLC